MKKLQEFKAFKLNDKETTKLKGGGPFENWLLEKILEEAFRLARKHIFNNEDMSEYGKRIYEIGSPGGHK